MNAIKLTAAMMIAGSGLVFSSTVASTMAQGVSYPAMYAGQYTQYPSYHPYQAYYNTGAYNNRGGFRTVAETTATAPKVTVNKGGPGSNTSAQAPNVPTYPGAYYGGSQRGNGQGYGAGNGSTNGNGSGKASGNGSGNLSGGFNMGFKGNAGGNVKGNAAAQNNWSGQGRGQARGQGQGWGQQSGRGNYQQNPWQAQVQRSPQAQMKAPQMPNMQMQQPNMQMRAPNMQMQAPNMRMPNMQRPNMQMPNMQMPRGNMQMPNMQMQHPNMQMGTPNFGMNNNRGYNQNPNMRQNPNMGHQQMRPPVMQPQGQMMPAQPQGVPSGQANMNQAPKKPWYRRWGQNNGVQGQQQPSLWKRWTGQQQKPSSPAPEANGARQQNGASATAPAQPQMQQFNNRGMQQPNYQQNWQVMPNGQRAGMGFGPNGSFVGQPQGQANWGNQNQTTLTPSKPVVPATPAAKVTPKTDKAGQ